MPYKRVGRTVYVKRGTKWRPLKRHETTQKAQKHLVALRINVESKEKAGEPKRDGSGKGRRANRGRSGCKTTRKAGRGRRR